MMNAVGSAGSGREWTSRPAAFAGMGNQALLNAFLEEFRRQQAKSCEQDVDKVKRRIRKPVTPLSSESHKKRTAIGGPLFAFYWMPSTL